MRNRLVFRARRENWSGRIELAVGSRNGDGPAITHAATSIEFQPIEEAEEIRDWIGFTPDEAQALVDELWLLGVRPSEGTGSAGSLAATERHLEDMRRISFAALLGRGIQVDPK